MLLSGYHFRPINLKTHSSLCVEFRRDAFVASFGNSLRFDQESGVDGARYLEWLSRRIEAFPEGQVHVCTGDDIIGQMEMMIYNDTPRSLYVNLFYLVPTARGTGAGLALQEYVHHLSESHHLGIARLGVSPCNRRAMAYYAKHGWRDIGPDPARPDLHIMEKLRSTLTVT